MTTNSDQSHVDAMGDSSDSRTTSAVVPGSTVRRSASIAALAAAMAKAQGAISGASKDKTNPHFKSAYADLASVWDACREPLAANGIAVFQLPVADGGRVTLTTLITHASGEWIENTLTMAAGQTTPQAIGSCITYARRYALSSIVGVAPEDDDGNAASGGGNSHAQRQEPEPAKAPEGFENWVADLDVTASEGWAVLEAAWKKSQPYMRKYLTDTNAAKWEAIRRKAVAADKAKPKPEAVPA